MLYYNLYFAPVVIGLPSEICPKMKNFPRENTNFCRGELYTDIVRAAQRIKLRTNSNIHIFGVFIDFSNAYNNVKHDLLFAKLAKVLNEKEILFIKALYSRNIIRAGKECFTPNKGVPQGSSLSPALFDIYAEDLFVEIIEKGNVNMEDCLGMQMIF